MGVAEHMAMERRVELLERAILAVELVRFRTVLVICQRGHEERCETVEDVWRLADAAPSVEVTERRLAADVIIDAAAGVHLVRRADHDAVFDDLAKGMRTVEVPITCYPEQVELILSRAPITAAEGGTRAGKTRFLVWWLWIQWQLLGHGANDEHEFGAVFWWVREDTGKLFRHAILWIQRLWPDEAFIGKLPGPTTKDPFHELLDGSTIHYKHAAHSGKRAGTSLRSESVTGLVVDELSAIHHEENWREMKARVAQTAGPIATAFTPTAGHWSEQIAKGAPASGGAVVVRKLVMTMNPWWRFTSMWIDLLKDNALTATELEEKVLGADDQAAAARAAVVDPNILRMRWGVSSPVGLTLWRLWDAKRCTWRGPDPVEVMSVGGVELRNITGSLLGPRFGAGHGGILKAGGKDFNVASGVTVVFRVFGDPEQPYIYVFEEVVSSGPTLVNAEAVAKLHPGLCMHCDPTGALGGRHQSHGPRNMSDAETMRQAGLVCEPANDWLDGKVKQLNQLNSINAMHRAMKLGLLRVHPRCVGVLRALTDMRANPDGTIAKTSGQRSVSDRVSDYGDALRYGVWPVLRHLVESTTRIH